MTNPISLAPKPFVFVLMPFDGKYNDIYKFGIRGAAEDIGAYAERLDDQMFVEGMLDRIFNQISKADVIVGDMTGRNPNVFYEVGYAHALGKIVILLTQDVADIPFDFKHRQHIVYGGQIDLLRQELSAKLQWAINESKKGRTADQIERFSLMLWRTELREGTEGEPPLVVAALEKSRGFILPLRVRNDGFETVQGISHVYLFTEANPAVVPSEKRTIPVESESSIGGVLLPSTRFTVPATKTIDVPLEPFVASTVDAYDGLTSQYRLKLTFPTLPPGAVEVANLLLGLKEERAVMESVYRLRLHTPSQFHEYRFRLRVRIKSLEDAETQQEEAEATEASDTSTQAAEAPAKAVRKRRRKKRASPPKSDSE